MRRMITAILGAVIFLVLPSSARADIFQFALTFEGIPVEHEVDDYYSGLGIHFTAGFIANGDYGPPCQFGGGPCSAQLRSTSVTMYVDSGFETGLGSYYNNSDGTTQVFIYDSLGNLLAGGTIPPDGGGMGDWPGFWIPFQGTAYSVEFYTENTGIEFTQLNNYGPPIPEPTSLVLLATGVAGLAGWRRRRDSTQK
jgi:hypothetical protein